MNTPIADFVRRYGADGFSRLHMPGHKGRGPLGCEALDLTEIRGADELYAPEGIILESERHAAALFGAARTFYATEGSSQCIRAMVFLAAARARAHGRRARFLAARNVHKAFIYACALADAEVSWLYPAAPEGLCSCTVTPAGLRAALGREPEPPAAVYVTSPDYLGRRQDLRALAGVCRACGVPLLVDNAHGAYLHFLPVPEHPLDLGAAMCCDSGHKTLPVLTGGAYLHLGPGWPEWEDGAREALALFGSTSPSYLILQSLDLCNRTLAEDYPRRLAACAAKLAALCAAVNAAGPILSQPEPLRLVVDAARMGLTGFEVADGLRLLRVECEYADRDHVVLMASPDNDPRDFARVRQALCGLPRRTPRDPEPLPAGEAEARMSIRAAIFAPHETLAPRAAVGRICGSPAVSCPPAVPIAVSGEVITAAQAALFERCGIARVEVVRQD